MPVLLSSLLLTPMLLACLGDTKKHGIITASVPSLTDDLLKEAGVLDPSRIVMGDLGDKPALRGAYLDCNTTVELSRELMVGNPDVALILLECTALPDFAATVQEAVQVPVTDIVSLIDLFVHGFAPQSVRSLM